jgi:filamentous hemagglutinin family protein
MTLATFLRGSTALCSILLPALVWAGPEGGVVTHGSAQIIQSGTTTTINQISDRAVLDWQSFNLSADESARFNQPGAHAITVNRIHDINPSQISGKITADGHVVLINSNGVVFGQSARVDMGSLTVSTASPTDADAASFAAGHRHDLPLTIAGKPDAQIINNGVITVKDAGLVGFVAPSVKNSGIIRAFKGKVALAAGDTATLDLFGDGLVDVAVSHDTWQKLVHQGGLIEAHGGTVFLTAAAGQDIANNLIQMDGTIQANSIAEKNGKIILSAAGSNNTHKTGNSLVIVSGTLNAKSPDAGTKGGNVTITGDNITLTDTAKIDVSGVLGGGTVKIGGDYQGKGTLDRAQHVTLEKNSVINADALEHGDGGRVIVWSDNMTRFDGDILARGGALSGNGGFVETSAKQTLKATGHVNLSAPHGVLGTWLLDPANITIYGRSHGGATDNDSSFLTSYLEGQNAHINLLADNNITLDLQGDILAPNAGHNITLTATSGNINFISSGGLQTSGAGGITLNAGGTIYLSGNTITTQNGNLTLSGTTALSANQTLNAGTGLLTVGAINAGAHNLSLISDDVAINGNLAGTGTLHLATASNNINMRLNHYPQPGEWGIDAFEIARLQHGWDHIIIGREDQAGGQMYLGETIWKHDVTFAFDDNRQIDGPTIMQNGSSVTFLNGSTNIQNTITTDGGNITFTRNLNDRGSAFLHNATLTTAGGNISFVRVLAAQGTNHINSNGGNITFNDKYSETYRTSDINLNINAGSGNIHFADVVNGVLGGGKLNLDIRGNAITFTNPWGLGVNWDGEWMLGNVTLRSNNTNMILPQIRTFGNLDIGTGTGTLTFNGVVDVAQNLTARARQITSNAIIGQTFTTANVSLTSDESLSLSSINANSILARTLNNNADITIASGSILTANGAGNAVTLASGRHINNQSGGAAISTPNGRWLLYAKNAVGSTLNGLTPQFTQYECTYAGSCTPFPAGQNGMLYSDAEHIAPPVTPPKQITETLSMQSRIQNGMTTMPSAKKTVSVEIEVRDVKGDYVIEQPAEDSIVDKDKKDLRAI